VNSLALIAVFGIGGWEVMLILALLLILVGAKRLPLAASRQGNDQQFVQATKLFVAQGFGIGRIPFAPGTFGTLFGFAWFALLIAMGNFWAYLAAVIESIALSIWLCDEAEKILGKTDPGSVVLDEIVAIPLCFLPWLISEWIRRDHVMPPLETFFTGQSLIWTALIFAAFRLFDIWKPWPVRGLQRLPGGWGVTVDDLAAALYVALITIPFVA